MSEHTRSLLWPSLSPLPYLDVPSSVEEALAAEFPEFQIVVARDEVSLGRAIAECEVFVSWTLQPEQFARFRRLKWIHSPAAGVKQILLPGVVESEIIVTNGRTVHAVPVAEHAIALMFALARHIAPSVLAQKEGKWRQQETWAARHLPTELNGKTLGLIGMGSISREIAMRAKALAMRVVAVRRDASLGAPHADAVYPFDHLSTLLEQSDFVVLAVPDTPETIGMIGAEQLVRMKPSAFLINIARGSLVHSRALVEALNAGIIAGAALDVTDPEPPPPGDPLWTARNILITPHIAGATERFWPRQLDLLRQNLGRYIKGEPLLNVVDKRRGY